MEKQEENDDDEHGFRYNIEDLNDGQTYLKSRLNFQQRYFNQFRHQLNGIEDSLYEANMTYIRISGGQFDDDDLIGIMRRRDVSEYVRINMATGRAASCLGTMSRRPLELYSPVGMIVNGTHVACGGSYPTRKCHHYSSGQYQDVPEPCPVSTCYTWKHRGWERNRKLKLKPARVGAISVEIRPNEWLIMGGNSGDYLNDTQLFKDESFIKGPDLPVPMQSASSVMLNRTHLFLAAGEIGNKKYSNANYLLNINTNKWTKIADRPLEAQEHHASGTFYNKTVDEIQVANVASSGLQVYSPQYGNWTVDKTHRGYFYEEMTLIQRGPNSFFIIGGWSRFGHSVVVLDENGLKLLGEYVLSSGRQFYIAMPISKDDFTCVNYGA